MITAEELIQTPEKQEVYKMGTVAALFGNNTAQVIFDGEDTASQKQYAYLNNYSPAVNDRVLMAAVADTYIVLGKLNFKVAPAQGGGNSFTDITTSGSVTVGTDLKISGKVGFFGTNPRPKVSISSPSSIQTTGTADSSYSSNEVTMLNSLKTDVSNLRDKLKALMDALSGYNLI